MQKKILFGLMVIAIVGLLLANGCVKPTPCKITSWSPDASTVCSGTTFTQTSNCGTTRNVVGIKYCPPPISCVNTEPTTREELKNWNLELRSEFGYPPEPFLLNPEKDYQCTNGYFPCTIDELPTLGDMMCDEYHNVFVDYGYASISEVIKGRNIYTFNDGGFRWCMKGDRISVITGNKQIVDKYFDEFLCE